MLLYVAAEETGWKRKSDDGKADPKRRKVDEDRRGLLIPSDISRISQPGA
jgi:hypothetical protein